MTSDPALLHRAQPVGAQADHGADRRRHGAGRVRVRRGADARRRAAARRWWRPAQHDNVVVIAARGGRPRCRAASTRDQARAHRDAARGRARRRRPAAGLEGNRGADRAPQARHRTSRSNVIVRGVSPRGHRAAAAGADRRRPHVPRPARPRSSPASGIARRFAGAGHRRAAALRRARLDRWSAFSTPAAAASTPRSGATSTS